MKNLKSEKLQLKLKMFFVAGEFTRPKAEQALPLHFWLFSVVLQSCLDRFFQPQADLPLA